MYHAHPSSKFYWWDGTYAHGTRAVARFLPGRGRASRGRHDWCFPGHGLGAGPQATILGVQYSACHERLQLTPVAELPTPPPPSVFPRHPAAAFALPRTPPHPIFPQQTGKVRGPAWPPGTRPVPPVVVCDTRAGVTGAAATGSVAAPLSSHRAGRLAQHDAARTRRVRCVRPRLAGRPPVPTDGDPTALHPSLGPHGHASHRDVRSGLFAQSLDIETRGRANACARDWGGCGRCPAVERPARQTGGAMLSLLS